MLPKIFLVSILCSIRFLPTQSAPSTTPNQVVAASTNRAQVNLTTAEAVQRQVQQLLATNGTETKPTFFFTNVGPNSFEYRGMFSPGKAPPLDFHKSFADFFDNFPKFPNLQFHTHTVINHRTDQKPVKPTSPPVTYPSPITVPVIPTVPPVPAVRIPPVKPRRIQKVRPFTRIKPTPAPNYQQNQPESPPQNVIPVSYFPRIKPTSAPNYQQNQPESPPQNVIPVSYFPKPPEPPTNPFLYQTQPIQPYQPPLVYQNQPTPPPPPTSLTHLLEQQPPFDLYRLTIPGTNTPTLLGNPGLTDSLNNINNPYQNHFINPLPRIDSPNVIQQRIPQSGPPEDNNPFQFPFAFPEYHIVRGQDRAESYPKIFRFEDGRTNIVEFEREKKRFRKRKGDRISGPVDTDPLSPDRVGRDKFLILHGGFYRQKNEVVSQRYTERFSSFYYDSNELQDNAESMRTTVTDTKGTTSAAYTTKGTKSTKSTGSSGTVTVARSGGSTKESGRSRTSKVAATRTTKPLGLARTTKASTASRTTSPNTTVTPKPKPTGYGYRI